MDPTARQYETYPYPERDPADEDRRLIEGSPSHPAEIDHFLFRGRRDWRQPFRALVAGGGTGDALIMLAQMLSQRGTPADIVYLDLSRASRAIAEARAARRGLTNVRFETADLAAAPELGPFDYIDCCGVLHHLPEPQVGFDALARALAPEGGLGVMVYAPWGRAGVYELQSALRPLVDGLEPAEQIAIAKAVLAELPPTHAFAKNPLLGDHRANDAGLYDLLLHARDTPFTVSALLAALDQAGLSLVGLAEPARYEPATYLSDPAALARAQALPDAARMAMAERLAGNLKVHVAYAAPKSAPRPPASAGDAEAIPVLRHVPPAALAKSVAKTRRLRFTVDGLTIDRPARRSWPGLIAAMDGRTPLGALQQRSRLDWMAFQAEFAPLAEILVGFNTLNFSGFFASPRA